MTKDIDAENEWISTKQAAEAIGIPIRHLYRLIDEGALPAYKFGRVLRLRRDEVDHWLETHG